MKNWNRKKKILIILLTVFIVAQAIQPSKNLGNPHSRSDIRKTVHVPDSIFTLLKNSCYDCHSGRTNYPWYDHITPVNWWVADHINEGKRELNFTTFSKYPKALQLHKLKEIAETVQEGSMPLKSYLLLHADARLSAIQKNQIYQWAKNEIQTLNQKP